MSIDIDAIRARLAAATPGPWEWEAADGGLLMLGTRGDVDAAGHVLSAFRCKACQKYGGSCLWPTQPNADLIAHAPTDIAALLARVAELEAELANERGEGEPPSEGWRYSHARDRWEHPRLRSTWRTGWTRCADGTDHVTWGWEIGFSDSVFAEGRELTARAAMTAADVKAKEEV